jgi:hypothetical protein
MKKASALESKRRGRLVKIATGDLLALNARMQEELSQNIEPGPEIFERGLPLEDILIAPTGDLYEARATQ